MCSVLDSLSASCHRPDVSTCDFHGGFDNMRGACSSTLLNFSVVCEMKFHRRRLWLSSRPETSTPEAPSRTARCFGHECQTIPPSGDLRAIALANDGRIGRAKFEELDKCHWQCVCTRSARTGMGTKDVLTPQGQMFTHCVLLALRLLDSRCLRTPTANPRRCRRRRLRQRREQQPPATSPRGPDCTSRS